MTVDMTNNRVPYGLLTDEEKAALHEHEKAGGVIEFTYFHHWSPISKPTWGSQTIYRTVPLPAKTQDVIAWDRLPDWVEWVARNKDGTVWCFQFDPEDRSGVWLSRSKYRRIDDFPGIVVQIGTCDWKDSKQRRPR